MRGFPAIWSVYVKCLFGDIRRSTRRRSSLRRRDYTPACIAVEILEERALLSATFGSAVSIGNDTGSSKAFDVAADAAGNSYVTGHFTGTLDFDPAATHFGDTDILTARGSNDAFVAKYASDNSLAWVQRMGGDALSVSVGGAITDLGRKIEIDGSGSVYVAGEFIGSSDFGSTNLSTPGDKDGFVAKLDAGGTVQWAKSWGTGFDMAQGLGVDSAGNVYALGFRHYEGCDVLKFSPTGGAVWSKSIATHSYFSSADLAVNASGNVFVAGSFTGTVDFDPSSKTKYVSSGPSHAGFVLKLDTAGKFDWVSPFVGQTVGSTNGFAFAQSVALDGSGNVIVGGGYYKTVDFNPGSGTTTLPTIGGAFITKLNSSGGFVWARALESSASTFVYGLDVDAAGSIYAVGTFFGTVDLNPGAGVQSRTAAGMSDIFVVKLTATGNFGWAETFGGTGEDRGIGIAVDPTGALHLAGWYQETVDFDPDSLSTYNLTNSGTFNNAFRLRLRQA